MNDEILIRITSGIIGFLLATLIFLLISKDCNDLPPLPVIIDVPALSDDIRKQIDGDILFDKAFKRFSECMEDANKTTAEDCRKEFWNSGKK